MNLGTGAGTMVAAAAVVASVVHPKVPPSSEAPLFPICSALLSSPPINYSPNNWLLPRIFLFELRLGDKDGINAACVAPPHQSSEIRESRCIRPSNG